MKYNIAAIPTLYRGRRYRSRLEAKWAAFFDGLGWTHEYEPFELDGWIPDFLLTGKCVSGRVTSALVEVKPIMEFDPEVALEMQCADEHPNRNPDIPPVDRLLLLGVAPSITRNNRLTSGVQLGWVVANGCDEDGNNETLRVEDNEAIFKLFYDNGVLRPDFADCGYGIGGCLTGFESYCLLNRSLGELRWFRPDILETSSANEASERLMQAWAEASNIVQWKGGRA